MARFAPRRYARLLIPLSTALLLILLLGRAGSVFYTDTLWFESLGYSSTFWTRVIAELITRTSTTLIAAALIFLNLWFVARRLGPVHVRRRYGNLEIAEQVPRRVVQIGMFITALLTGLWLSDVKFGGDRSLSFLTFFNQVSWGISDPLFNRDLSYYVFSLPVYLQVVDFLLLIGFWSILLSVLGYALVGSLRWRANRVQIDERPRFHLAIIAAALVALLGVRLWIGRYGVLFQGTGFSDGVGYTDVHARLPGLRIIALLSIATAGALLYGAQRRSWLPPTVAGILLVLGALLLGVAWPSFIQKFRVEPNQFGREAAYIRWNMQFTRAAYGIDSIERRQYAYRSIQGRPVDPAALQRLPLWDKDPLKTAFTQVQSLYPYYSFNDVDFDRYRSGDGDAHVAIGVREFNVAQMQASARTWQTLHLNTNFVRGVGAVVAPANQKNVQGEPVFWLRNVNPVEHSPAAPPEMQLTEPSVYFGEQAEQYLITGARTDAAARPEIESLIRGVPISSFLRVIAFSWRFGDRNLLFSGQLTDESKVIFRRQIRERLDGLAPFLLWDRDPYPVIHEGRIFWLVDGYSVTANYPIARPLDIQDAGRTRYLRNSVKATIDAATGAVRIYALDSGEPYLATYARTFRGLIQPLSEMPAALRAHLRYPTFVLRAQADMLEEYHLATPEAFYAGQDVWQLPRERGAQAGQPYSPIYTTMSFEPDTPPEFLLVAPFIANQRQNMTALMIARNDVERYGQLILYELPRDQQIPGPAQVESNIEQDPTISPVLTLWRQAGSNLDLGQVRVVPLDSAFVYVIPVFLAAAGSPIPGLERVIVSDGSRAAMGSTIEEAVANLNSGAAPAPPSLPQTQRAVTPALPSVAEWPTRALDLLNDAERSLQNRDWAGYGRRMNELRALLEQLSTGQRRP